MRAWKPPRECKFKNATCHKCGKVGHIKPVCRGGKPPKYSNSSAHYVEEEEPIYVVKDQGKSSRPFQVQLKVNGQTLQMEVDTGAAVSLAPESSLASILPAAMLKQTSVMLKTYTGEQIPVKGTITVDVTYGQQQHRNMELLVVGGSGPSLMGQNWLKVVRLD